MTNRYRSRQYTLKATDSVASAIDTAPSIRAAAYQRRNLLSSMVILAIGGCDASSAPPTPSNRPGPTPGGTRPVPPSRPGLRQLIHDEADCDDEVGDAEQQPDPARATDILARRGEPERADVRRERGEDGEQRDGDDDGEHQAVAAGDAEAEVEVPRQQQREDEQRDRDSVAHGVGAGGHVADSGRPGNDGRGGGRHRDGVGRVVTLVAHVTISSPE